MGEKELPKRFIGKDTNKNLLKNLLNNRAFSLLLLIIFLSIIMSFLYPQSFFSFSNLSAILLSVVSIGILSIGMAFLLISGTFDLSVGANLAIGAAVAAYVMNKFQIIPIPVAMIIGISASMCAGLANGLIVAKIRLNALITTFAMMGILRAIATVIAGTGIVALPESFLVFGQLRLFGFQLPIYYMFILIIIFSILATQTRYFRQLYFIGGNEKAAKISGIDVDRQRILSFILMGALAGIAGVIQTARMNAAIGTMATGVELQVITAVIIGGGSIAGGRGTVAGAFMGALFVAFIQNMMVIAGVNVYAQGIVIGAILILAVSLDVNIVRRYST